MRTWLFVCLLQIALIANGQSLRHCESIEDPELSIECLLKELANNKSNPEIYYLIGSKKMQMNAYDSCIFYCNKSIALLAKKENKILLIKTLHLKGNAEYYLDDKVNALDNWNQALSLAINQDVYTEITTIASNLGAIYLDKAYNNNSDPILFKKADSFLAISHKEIILKDSLVSTFGLNNLRLIATSYQLQKQYDSANYYYEKVINISRGNPKFYTSYLGGLTFYAESLSEIGAHAKAIAVINEAVDFAAKNDLASKDKTHVMHIYAEVLQRSGNFKDAYKYVDSSYKLLAEDYQKVNAEAYAESESKFKNEILRYQVELEKQKKTRLYFIIVGIGLIMTLIVFVLMYKNNKRIAKEKARQKQIAIDAFIEGEEKEKVRIGRELHDGIAQEIVAVKLAMQQNRSDTNLVNELTRICNDIRTISHELMPQTLKEYGLRYAIEDICQKILAPSGIIYELHSNLTDVRLDHKIEITLYRIAQELIHNIIKHSNASEVLIQLRKASSYILLVVEDNGKGMAAEKKMGIGISNLKSRVQLLDGNIQYDSNENEGTTAIVRLPL